MQIEKITNKQVENWIREFGSTPTIIDDANTEWHYEFDYPVKTQHRTHILQPKGSNTQIVVLAGLRISEDHQEQFSQLSSDEQKEFILKLQGLMTTPEVDFKMEGKSSGISSPQNITFSKVRFSDGLTLDSVYQSVGQVFKAKLQAIYFFNLHLSDLNSSGGDFKFKPVLN